MRTLLMMCAVMFVACAAPAPYYFPPANPTPTYTPLGTGLVRPTAPRPGAQNVPRSPSKRVLPPPGDQPGMWSADTVRASGSLRTNRRLRMLFGVELPLPPEEVKEYGDRLTNGCAGNMSFAAERAKQKSKAEALPLAARTCLAAKLYAQCAARTVVRHESMRDALEFYDPAVMRAEKAVKETADTFAKLACESVPWDDALEGMFSTILNRSGSSDDFRE